VWTAGLRDGPREAVAGANLRRREIHLDRGLRGEKEELRRIFTHEVFHFAWVRLGNPKRASWKELLGEELAAGARGELGWSSEWRKQELPARFAGYACEAFCDTGAYLFAGVAQHEEYTLARRWRGRRREWFAGNLGKRIRI
jgi:hypothetical protein